MYFKCWGAFSTPHLIFHRASLPLLHRIHPLTTPRILATAKSESGYNEDLTCISSRILD